MRSTGLMLIGALAAGACGDKQPELDADDLARTAAAYVALHNDYDSAKMAALYGKKKEMTRIDAEVGWLRGQLGACGSAVPMWREGLTNGRFRAPCERGELEFFLDLDDRGQLAKTIRWAVGVPTPAAVERAAHDVVAAMPWDREQAGKQPWGEALHKTWVRRLGRCEIAGVRSVTGTAGRFDLHCEHGNALMKVRVDGGTPRVGLWPSNVDKTRAWELEIMG